MPHIGACSGGGGRKLSSNPQSAAQFAFRAGVYALSLWLRCHDVRPANQPAMMQMMLVRFHSGAVSA